MTLYRLQSHRGYGFETGHGSRGTQIILGTDRDICLAVVFDPAGAMIEVIERSSGTTWDDLSEAMASLKRDLQFVEATITVSAFNLFERGRFIGISEMPAEYEDYLENPTSVDPAEAQELLALIDSWRESGDFVVWGNEDYWCGPDGEIHTH